MMNEPTCWLKFMGVMTNQLLRQETYEVGLTFYEALDSTSWRSNSPNGWLTLVVLKPFEYGPSREDLLKLCEGVIFPQLSSIFQGLPQDFTLGCLPDSEKSNPRFDPEKGLWTWTVGYRCVTVYKNQQGISMKMLPQEKRRN